MSDSEVAVQAAAFGEKGIEISDLRDAYQFAKYVVASRLAPAGLDSPEKVLVAVQTGMEAGLKPMSALRSVYVINGAPAWRGDAALGLIRASGLLEDFSKTYEGSGDDLACTVRMTRKDAGSTEETFSMQDARDAGLYPPGNDRSPWKKYPRRMIYYRALGFAARDLFSDVLGNLYIAEELMDGRTAEERLDRAKDVSPPAGHQHDPDPLFEETAKSPEILPPEGAGAEEPQGAEPEPDQPGTRGGPPSLAEQALGSPEEPTGPPEREEQLEDDHPVPQEPDSDAMSPEEEDRQHAGNPGPKMAVLTERPKRRTQKAMLEVLEKIHHPMPAEALQAWTPDQRTAAWEWAWEELWYQESVEQGADDQSPNPLPRPSFIPEYGDIELTRPRAAPEAPQDACGKPFDLDGTLCPLQAGHSGPCGG